MKPLVSAIIVTLGLASPALATDRISGAWTTGGPAPQTFIFKASGERFAGIACGPCDKAASVLRVEDGRMLDADRVSFVVSYDTAGPRFKELGPYRDRFEGSLVNGRLSLSAKTEGHKGPASTVTLTRVIEGFVPDTTNVPPSSLLTADPAVAPSPIEGRWVFPGRVAQQNATMGRLMAPRCGSTSTTSTRRRRRSRRGCGATS
jgi:hypothetical protein